MSEHTKGRWYRAIKPNGRASVRLEETGETLASDLSPADAERIVLMHASHDALVEALKNAIEAISYVDIGLPGVQAARRSAVLAAREALALAKGE